MYGSMTLDLTRLLSRLRIFDQRRLRPIVFVSLMMLTLSGWALGQERQPSRVTSVRPTLRLQVVDRDAEGVLAPVPHARVSITAGSGRQIAARQADANGWYAADLGSGDFLVDISAPGRQSARLEVMYEPETGLFHVRRDDPPLFRLLEPAVRLRPTLLRAADGDSPEPGEPQQGWDLGSPKLYSGNQGGSPPSPKIDQVSKPPNGPLNQLIPHQGALSTLVAGSGPKPDLSVKAVQPQVVKTLSQYVGDIKVAVTITNVGTAPFDFSNAHLAFYNGPYLEGKKTLGKLPAGASTQFDTTLSVSYFPPHGAKAYGDGLVKIEYDPKTKAPGKAHIDNDFQNNTQTFSHAPLEVSLANVFRDGYRKNLLKYINQHRGQNGAKPLVLDSTLNQSSQKHSVWMKSIGVAKHKPNTYTAENVYDGSMNPQSCFTQWKGSAGHNKNMLGGWTKIGIGQEGGYVTAQFQ